MYSANAILLKSFPSGEYDEVASFFTKEFGKITIKAKGAKKIKTKQGNFLHRPALVRFSFVAGRQGYILSGVADIKSYPHLGSDLLSQAYVLSFFSLCEEVLYNEEKDINLWKLLKSVLADAEKSSKLPEDEKILSLWKQEKSWLMSLLSVLGLSPADFNPNKAKSRAELDRYIQGLLQQAFERRIDFFGLKQSARMR